MKNEELRVVEDNYSPDILIRKAKETVLETINSREPEVQSDDLYIVWFAKELQNWKAVLVLANDKDRQFEVTHNGDRQETYITCLRAEYRHVIAEIPAH